MRGTAATPIVAVLILLAAFLPGTALAQQKNRAAIGSPQDAVLIATLVRSYLIALHQANVTGNYEVLRDLGAPSFRERNTAAGLAASFAQFRRRNIDLQAVAVLQPEIIGTPVIDADDLLRVSGTFPTEPIPIRFDLAFQVVNRVWRLIGITVAPMSRREVSPHNAGQIPLPTPRPNGPPSPHK